MRSSVLRYGWLGHNRAPTCTFISPRTNLEARPDRPLFSCANGQRRQAVSVPIISLDPFTSDFDEVDEPVADRLVPAQPLGLADAHARVYRSAKSRIGQIRSFEQWLHESDVTASNEGAARLVDRPDHRLDYPLWIRFLKLRLRLDGYEGAWKIYQGLRQRRIDLPTEGPSAQQLWDPIVSAAIHLQNLNEVFQYASDLYRRTGQRYERLYPLVVGHYLPKQLSIALRYDERLRTIGLPASGGLRSTISPSTLSKIGSVALWKIYNSHPEPGLYDRIVTSLCARKQWRKAFVWHVRLTGNHDFPSSAQILDPLMRQLLLSGQTKKLDRVKQCLSEAGLSDQLQSVANTSGEVLRWTASGITASATEAAESGRKIISDDFCARAFATRAFTPSLVIRTLSTFGVRSIGPISFRELAVRCRYLVKSFKADESDINSAVAREICVQLDHLKANGIATRDCAFTRFVSGLARDGNGELLESTLSCDQHPEVYDDANVQLDLLRSYTRAEDWLQVHRTLALLAMISKDPIVKATTGWNILLRAVLDSDSPAREQKVLQILRTMRNNRISVSTPTLRHSYLRLLTPRNASKQPVREDHAIRELEFITRIWVDMSESGLHVPARCWEQVIRQHGHLSLWSGLERLCIWLAQTYSDRFQTTTADFRRRSKGQLNLLFPPNRQRAFIQWYMKTLQHPHLHPGESDDTLRSARMCRTLPGTKLWARGLALLLALRKHGLDIDTSTVRAAVRQRLVTLFGPGISKRPHNRVAARENPYSLRAMVRYMQLVWLPVGRLFPLPRSLLVPRESAVEEERVEQILRRLILGEVVTERLPGQFDRRMRMRLRYRGVYGEQSGFPSPEELEAAVVSGTGIVDIRERLSMGNGSDVEHGEQIAMKAANNA